MNSATFKDIKKFIPAIDGERFAIQHFQMSEDAVKLAKLQAMFGGSYGEVYSLHAGSYVKLIDKQRHEVVMSDTPMELETNSDFVDRAKGNVLIGGLGLGLVVLAIQSKKDVKNILICEKEQEIISMIKNNAPFNKKVQVVHSDIFDFRSDEKFDVIYFDIWNTISSDNYEDMKRLHRQFRKNLNTDGWMSSWRYEHCKALKRRESREDRMWQ